MVNPVITAVGNATKHAILRSISVICVLLVCAGVYYAIYRTFIKPRPTQNYAQKAESITNNEWNYDYSDKDIAFLGIKFWKIRLGITIK
jgi:uncharacterized membrane protein